MAVETEGGADGGGAGAAGGGEEVALSSDDWDGSEAPTGLAHFNPRPVKTIGHARIERLSTPWTERFRFGCISDTA